MARGEITGDIIGIDVATALSNAYSASTAYGHASAGKDLVLSMNATGRAVLGANNTGIAGVFIELRPNKKASVLISKVLIMRQSAVDACTTGHPVICAGSGQIKNAGSDDDGAGLVLKVIENTANGRVLVRFP